MNPPLTFCYVIRLLGVAKEGLGSKHGEVVLAEIVALHGARAELKRLAKENTKQVGRKLAPYTNTCPLVVFNHVLNQVEAFDNLIPYIVDCLKFSTELARDVMAYTLIAQLKKGSTGDAKLKKGDTHFSQWFSALSKFIAVFYCRYPTTELKGLFNYLLQRLSIGDSLDLLVLKELLGVMGGSETLLEVSPAQLDGLSGGRALRAEVMGVPAGVVGSKGMISAPACRKATTILRDELTTSQTAIPMLLLLAQVRSRLLHDEDTKQLKLISHLYDTAQDVLMQFTEFLVAGAKSLESIAALMPDMSVLLDEVGLEVPVAFQLVRPLLRAALQCGVDASAAPAHLKRWHPFGPHITTVVKTLIHPASIWEHLSPRLYVLFWSLGLYDLRVPAARYETEIKRLKDRYTELDAKKASSTSGSAASLGLSAAEISKQNKARDTEMRQIMQKVADLTDDQAKQKKHIELIKDVIRAEQHDFFRVPAQPSTAEGENVTEVLYVNILDAGVEMCC
jgi:THO complex subunit 2